MVPYGTTKPKKLKFFAKLFSKVTRNKSCGMKCLVGETNPMKAVEIWPAKLLAV